MKTVAALAFLSGCQVTQGALQPKGPKALAILELGGLFFWIALVVLAAIVVASLWAFARGSRHPADAEPVSPDAVTERRLTRAVAASTAVSLLLLAIMLVASVATGKGLSDFAPPKPLHVKITAHQWWWHIEYQGASPQDVVVTANELHIPAGQPVDLELTSADVIHSLWIPNLDGKHDLIPSHRIHTMIEADAPGAYYGRCAEFCGYQHAHMDLVVVAETPDDFAAWLGAQRQLGSEPQTEGQKRGREVVEHGPCALCHTVAGTRALGGVGPDLTHLASRRALAGGAAALDRGSLESWIKNPAQLKPGAQMPAIELSPSDLRAVVDYLESLR